LLLKHLAPLVVRTQDKATTWQQGILCVAGPVAWNSLPFALH